MARALALLFLAMLSCCGSIHESIEELDGTAFKLRCGWQPDIGGEFKPEYAWVRAYSGGDDCGLLPVGVDPCDVRPWSVVTYDGTPLQGWHTPVAACGPYTLDWLY